MPLKIVFSRPQNWSRLKPYYQSTTTAVKVLIFRKTKNKQRANKAFWHPFVLVPCLGVSLAAPRKVGGVLRGNTIRGNRPERF